MSTTSTAYRATRTDTWSISYCTTFVSTGLATTSAYRAADYPTHQLIDHADSRAAYKTTLDATYVTILRPAHTSDNSSTN